MSDLIVGIDLGTTNSEVATFVNDHVQVLGYEKNNMLPSVVGLSPSGELLVGEPARNQLVLYPERTVRSIKRKMGSNEIVMLGDRQFTPPEISALILRKLAAWAWRSVQQPVHKAVITVPAYFSDAQRQATREAAALAGLEAIRILNEPTAASLAYGEGTRHTAMVYDLGGGTFDVSIVALEGAITEVLASHGNNQLGGDDFNDLLAEHLLAAKVEAYVEMPKTLIPIRASAKQLEVVFGNLIKNAAEAMLDSAGPRRLEIAAKQMDGKVIVTVADTGPGIKPSDLPHVFQSHYSTKGPKGAGIGLTLCRQIIEAHKGTIEVASSPGHGATFTITLPTNAG